MLQLTSQVCSPGCGLCGEHVEELQWMMEPQGGYLNLASGATC